MLGVLIVSIFTIGYLREFVFVNINEQLRHLYYETDETHISESMKFLSGISYMKLYYGKWVLTGFFALIYLIISLAVIKLIFTEKRFLKWTVISFGTIISIAASCYVIGIVFSSQDIGYKLARVFMGVSQSPVILMVLIPAFMLVGQSRKSV